MAGDFQKSIITEVAIDKELGGNNLIFSQGPTLFKHDMSPRKPSVVASLPSIFAHIVSFVQIEISNGTWKFIVSSPENSELWWVSPKTMYLMPLRLTDDVDMATKTMFQGFPKYQKKLLVDVRSSPNIILYVMQPSVPNIVMLILKGDEIAIMREFLSSSESITPFGMGFSSSGNTIYITSDHHIYALQQNQSGQAPNLIKRLTPGSNHAILDLGNQNLIFIANNHQTIFTYNLISDTQIQICSNSRTKQRGIPTCGLHAVGSIIMFNSTFLLIAGQKGMRLFTGDLQQPSLLSSFIKQYYLVF